MEVKMKKLHLFLILALLMAWPAKANPIFLNCALKEIYFVDNDWTIILDNEFLVLVGATSFEGLQIQTNSGELNFKDDFQYIPGSWYTVITNDALKNPVIISPSIGYISVSYYNMYMPGLSWSNNPNASVNGPEEGQSLNNYPLVLLDFTVLDWWTIKGNKINCYNSNCSIFGYFSGYLTDQNNNPIPNAEIRYLQDFFMQAMFFSPLITNQNGYFNRELPAKNYHLFKIIIDGIDYEFDERVTIEPGENNHYDFQIVVSQVNETFANPSPGIANFPNPFSTKTTFYINLDGDYLNLNPMLEIVDMSGKIATIIDLKGATFSGNQMTLEWHNKSLPPGSYFATVRLDGISRYSHKIIIL